MNKVLAGCSFICTTAAIVVITAIRPAILSDENAFLLGFVNHEYLSFMAVLVTITLASAANIHIELNRYDEVLGKSVFERTRADLRHSAFALLGALCLALVTVIVKPLGPKAAEWQAAMNGLAVVTILFSVLIVADLTVAAFDLRPLKRSQASG